MNILVTGCAGFIGFHLSKRLLENGEKIIGFDNLNDYYDLKLKEARLEILKSFDESLFKFIKGNLQDKELIKVFFHNINPQL